jgi:hypothetical protein
MNRDGYSRMNQTETAATKSCPLPGMHMTGFAAVASVHMTILSLPVKHEALTELSLLLSVA